jgi:nicotinate phosphoribosyltransferase
MADVRDNDPSSPAEDPSSSLHGASPEEIRAGEVTAAHLDTTRQILGTERADLQVACEVRLGDLPAGWPWAILCGLEEVLTLLEGRDVEAWALPEGSVIYPEEPVLQIAGVYGEFVTLETAVVGMLAQPTGVATAAARLRLIAGGRPVYPLDLRALHPAVVPVVERAAYVGGCDTVSTPLGAELTGTDPVRLAGPELSLILGEPDAWSSFDATVEETVPRVVIVGTLEDERATAVAAAQALGDHLSAVCIQAPAADPTRLIHLSREVRWELDSRGRSDVRIIVSGDLNESTVPALARHVDGFGVGRAITAAPAADFVFEVVEVDGEARSRRGALSGRKTLWRCEACGNRGIAPARVEHEPCPRCEGRLRGLLVPRLKWGAARDDRPVEAAAIRARALKEAAEAPPPFPR